MALAEPRAALTRHGLKWAVRAAGLVPPLELDLLGLVKGIEQLHVAKPVARPQYPLQPVARA